MEETNKKIVRSFAEAGNRNDVDAFDAILTHDFVRHCEATPEVNVNSCEDFKEFYRETAKTFPDQRMNIDKLVAEGDYVAFWGTFSGTQTGPMGPFPPTGKKMISEIGGMFRIENGKIAELWVTWDNLSGLMQLGLFPPPQSD
ncbi:MAG: ester cyclase [Chlorobi bacterium]|nr:ester cyclase [Chlorobiota bacterium]